VADSWRDECYAGDTLLKSIASSISALLLTATFLWGGCLSCAQYFMFPASRAQHCCMPSSGCKDTPKKSQSSTPQGCTLQQVVVAKHAIALDYTPPAAPASPISDVPAPVSYYLANPTLIDPDRGSPPELYLLHSVFRI
jgi:hypothetical protein